MKYTYVIWDFNGTILDDIDIGIESINFILAENGIPKKLNSSEYRRIFCFPVSEYYKKIGFNFDITPFDVLAHRWVEEYLFRVHRAKTFDGVEKVIKSLNNDGIRQALLSATEEKMLKGQVKSLGFEGMFDEILGLSDIYAKNKSELALAWRARHPYEKTLLIGDTDHDYAVAKEIGANCILFSRGHQSRERLSLLGCEMFDSYADLKL